MMTVDFKSKRSDIIRIRYTRRGDYADETGIGITSVNLFHPVVFRVKKGNLKL